MDNRFFASICLHSGIKIIISGIQVKPDISCGYQGETIIDLVKMPYSNKKNRFRDITKMISRNTLKKLEISNWEGI